LFNGAPRCRRKISITGHTTCRSERQDKKICHQRWRTRERTTLASMSPENLDSCLGSLENEISNVWVDGQGWAFLLVRGLPGPVGRANLKLQRA
jgi:hypothetical protein